MLLDVFGNLQDDWLTQSNSQEEDQFVPEGVGCKYLQIKETDDSWKLLIVDDRTTHALLWCHPLPLALKFFENQRVYIDTDYIYQFYIEYEEWPPRDILWTPPQSEILVIFDQVFTTAGRVTSFLNFRISSTELQELNLAP